MQLHATEDGYDRFTGERKLEIRIECPVLRQKRKLFQRRDTRLHDSWWLGGMRQNEFDDMNEETKRQFVIDGKGKR